MPQMLQRSYLINQQPAKPTRIFISICYPFRLSLNISIYHETLQRNLELLQARWCVTNNIIKLFKQLADCFWLWSFCSRSSLVIVNDAVPMFPVPKFSERLCDEIQYRTTRILTRRWKRQSDLTLTRT